MLVVWNVEKWGYWPYAMMSFMAVIPFAVASWWVVERHALQLKTLGSARGHPV
jgi:peptidoglycan/LPS O-acetylase OafA/YrhL